MTDRHVIVTGAAGYIGSLLVSELLRLGYRVTAIDSLLYGGESLVPFLSHPNFHFAKADVTEARSVRDSLPRGWKKPSALFHLAAVVGFPACQAIGKPAAWRYNVQATQNVFEQAAGLGVEKFIYPSTYSVYGLSGDGQPVTEASPLNPQSLYAETKIAAEAFLQPAGAVIFRLATLYGLSPRTRFDLIVNQFVLDAYAKRELLIYQRGYNRSFVHVRDVVRGLLIGLTAPGGQIFNLGTPEGNYTKDQIVGYVLKRLPETMVQYKNLTFGGDMRDITVSFEKIQRELGFKATLTVDDGVREVVTALKTGMIRNPSDERYRNAHFIVQ
ncbi:MAG: NAD(P)-dependent oxidoreductase [Anaerolineae bacterium CG_4_9_14_3_um_filter_57_17]|nr:NAD(P)-dependent oxidoreductase [bacterium]NCT22008.1 NAD(P)-dependent oxidoreductase [bacterium]OIO86225.1 MAG: epimerase [Anaerolineae bacterium CG2_30_57_67]PJB67446.1 MAG: NAD(P)-dependent oxidoreductase [Anaerolineae bacterium CG_4_9_14_3_um_filter_57_17]